MSGVHFKLSLAGGDTSQGKQPWSVSPPTTASKQKRQFEMHPMSADIKNNFLTPRGQPGKQSGFSASRQIKQDELTPHFLCIFLKLSTSVLLNQIKPLTLQHFNPLYRRHR
jgi:hypothetical protein